MKFLYKRWLALLLALGLTAAAFSSCKEEEDNTDELLLLLGIGAVLNSGCPTNSGFAICVPPGIAQ